MSRAFSLGQELFFERASPHSVSRRVGRTVDPVAVSKVGRTWITVTHGREVMRFEIEPDEDGLFQVDGGEYSSPGRIWITREAHADYLARVTASEAISAALRRSRVAPPEIPTAMLVAMAALLPSAGAEGI